MTTSGWLNCEGSCNSRILLEDPNFETALLSGKPIICSACDPINGIQPDRWGSGAALDVSTQGPIPSRSGLLENNDLARESMAKIAANRIAKLQG